MNMMKKMTTMMEKVREIKLKDVIAYLQGHYRNHLYYNPKLKKFKWLLRSHIVEQFEFRVEFMKKECFNNGTCIKCGCTTTALQFANKSCKQPCYPPMMSRTDWADFRAGVLVLKTEDGLWEYFPNANFMALYTKPATKRIGFTEFKVYPQPK